MRANTGRDESGFREAVAVNHEHAIGHHVGDVEYLAVRRDADILRHAFDKNLYVPGKPGDWPALSSLIGGSINRKLIEREFDDVARLATSIQQGMVTASLILRKLSAYPRQNGLAVGLRELGRIERTLFTLKWLQDQVPRRRVSAGLNKGEARNSLARAVFFYRLGEIRDRTKTSATGPAA
jgi:TnpA family transposase